MKKRILLIIISVLFFTIQAEAATSKNSNPTSKSVSSTSRILQKPLSANSRLLQKPEWDGAIISGKWLNNEFRYQQAEISGSEDVNFLAVGPTFITSVPNIPKTEFGARLWLMNADYDHFKSETGLSDIDCWAKYQFYNVNNLLISGGILFTLPIGNDSIFHPEASGEVNLEFFGAARYKVSRITSIIGHVGIRSNDDADVEITSKNGFGSINGEIEGKNQIEIGAGIIYQLQQGLNLLSEFNIATEAYEDAESDIELTCGAEYILKQNMSVKGGLGFGLDDGAPKVELICGLTLLF